MSVGRDSGIPNSFQGKARSRTGYQAGVWNSICRILKFRILNEARLFRCLVHVFAVLQHENAFAFSVFREAQPTKISNTGYVKHYGYLGNLRRCLSNPEAVRFLWAVHLFRKQWLSPDVLAHIMDFLDCSRRGYPMSSKKGGL